MKRIVGFLIILISLLLIGPACGENELSKEETIQKAKELNIPIYELAQNVHFYSRGEKLKGVSYKETIPYGPMADEVLKFYDLKMKQIGYKPFVEAYRKDREWSLFIDGTKKGKPYVQQLSASWADVKKSKRANLSLRYYWYVDHKQKKFVLGRNEDLTVDFQYMPFIEFPPPKEINNEK